ncbi:NAD-dependent epimerase/dehydratase family protein [Nioella aestuarii]|uniref:NAD-dependent epimerase/dehydratase family protein n=1 Tax=Nioella aestuarii TaxID=1662864 RepID=UPI003D7F1D86
MGLSVFVTGASGFIGSAVVQELLARGHRVTGLSRTEQGCVALQAMGADAKRGDLSDPGGWSTLATGADAAIHLGTGFGPDMAEIDDLALGALIEAGKAGTRIIYTGGAWLFGTGKGQLIGPKTEFDPMPEFSWMVSGIKRLQAASVPHAVIHPAIVHNITGGAFASFTSALQAGRLPEIWGHEQIGWPLVHRRDLARAYRLVLEAPLATGSYTVAAEACVPVGRCVARLAARLGRPTDWRVLSRSEVLHRHGAMAAGPMRDQAMGSGRIREELGWRPVCAGI